MMTDYVRRELILEALKAKDRRDTWAVISQIAALVVVIGVILLLTTVVT